MRNVGTLHELNLLPESETCLVLLSPSIIHVLGLCGGVLVDDLYGSFMSKSTVGMGFNLLTLKFYF